MEHGYALHSEAVFSRRLPQLYEHWKGPSQQLWNGSNALLVATGTSSKEVTQSDALLQWLFGHELPETLVVLTNTDVYVLSNQRNVDIILQPLLAEAALAGISLHIYCYQDHQDPSIGCIGVQDLINYICTQDTSSTCWGVLPREHHHGVGAFLKAVEGAMAQVPGLQQVDVSAAVGHLMAVEEEDLGTQAMADVNNGALLPTWETAGRGQASGALEGWDGDTEAGARAAGGGAQGSMHNQVDASDEEIIPEDVLAWLEEQESCRRGVQEGRTELRGPEPATLAATFAAAAGATLEGGTCGMDTQAPPTCRPATPKRPRSLAGDDEDHVPLSKVICTGREAGEQAPRLTAEAGGSDRRRAGAEMPGPDVQALRYSTKVPGSGGQLQYGSQKLGTVSRSPQEAWGTPGTGQLVVGAGPDGLLVSAGVVPKQVPAQQGMRRQKRAARALRKLATVAAWSVGLAAAWVAFVFGTDD